jgi:hypothetical protein
MSDRSVRLKNAADDRFAFVLGEARPLKREAERNPYGQLNQTSYNCTYYNSLDHINRYVYLHSLPSIKAGIQFTSEVEDRAGN